MAVTWDTVIQRPGHASHRVEEREGTRYGGTYLWCDCGAWKFQHIGYTALFHEEWKRDDIPSLRLLET